MADCYLAVIWRMATLLEKWINKQLSSRGGVDVEGAGDCRDKETVGKAV